MKNIIIIIIIVFFTTGCEKVVDLKYKDNRSNIVIEGNITDQPGNYYVKISKSINLSDPGSYPTIDNAIVTIGDDAGNSETLTAQGNGLYYTTTTSGIPGRTYTLIVNAEGQTYTAESTMPVAVTFDSIKVEKFMLAGEEQLNIIPVYTDPLFKGNNYRFVGFVNSKIIAQHTIQNDLVRNGVVNTEGIEIDDNIIELKVGDTINISMQCIDKNVALYYTTLALIGDTGPGGGTTPNNPKNNISNGALGIFSAHTVETKTTIIQ